jgi:hypothetical protein
MKIVRTLLCAVFFTLLPVVLFAQWQPAIQLSTDTSAALNENMGQCLAVSGDSVHVVWEDFNVDSGAIFYRHSFDGGVTWGTIQRLTNLPSVAAFPSIAVFGNTVHVAYRDTRDTTYVSYYLRSLDGGNTWDPPVSLGNYYWWPSVTCSGQMVCVALNSNEPGNSEVWFRRSTDNGTSWDSVFQISNALGRSEDPSIACGGGSVHLAWNDNRTGIMETWYRRSSDNGVTWGPETQLTHSTVFCYFPVLHVNGSDVDLAYGDRQTEDYEIHFMQSTDFGVTWDSSQQMTSANGNEAYPNIGADGQNIYLVWWLFGGAVSIEHSGDGSATWDSAATLVPAANKATNPFIVDANGTLHVIWVDSTSGRPTIYYQHTVNPGTSNFSSNASVDFGSVKINQSENIPITLRNLGSSPFHILSYALVAPNGAFAFVDTSLHTIAPQDSGTVTVQFSPWDMIQYDATLDIATDESGGSAFQIMLAGEGTSGQAMVSTNEESGTALEVTPNPASSNATLRITTPSSLEDVKLLFYDAAARLIATQNIGSIIVGVQSIPLSLPTMDGVVFVRVTSGGAMVGTVAVAMVR